MIPLGHIYSTLIAYSKFLPNITRHKYTRTYVYTKSKMSMTHHDHPHVARAGILRRYRTKFTTAIK